MLWDNLKIQSERKRQHQINPKALIQHQRTLITESHSSQQGVFLRRRRF